MSIFYCPHCEKEHDIGDTPDHIRETIELNKDTFVFECDCGAEFECLLEWEPIIGPIKESLVKPEELGE